MGGREKTQEELEEEKEEKELINASRVLMYGILKKIKIFKLLKKQLEEETV